VTPDAPRARVAPGGRGDLKALDYGIARLLGLAAGTGPPNVFTTIGRHPRLFRRWLRFASALMPGGRLPRSDSELVILRVAHNCGCEYERRHHERLALAAGLDEAEVRRVAAGPDAEGWPSRRQLLLRAADELHATRTIGDELWADLRPAFTDVELIELCMLVGHYEMVAMTVNALGVQPDPVPTGPPPRLLRLAQQLVERRSRR
jgi:AhpD family alkylhydroperoxidase